MLGEISKALLAGLQGGLGTDLLCDRGGDGQSTAIGQIVISHQHDLAFGRAHDHPFTRLAAPLKAKLHPFVFIARRPHDAPGRRQAVSKVAVAIADIQG